MTKKNKKIIYFLILALLCISIIFNTMCKNSQDNEISELGEIESGGISVESFNERLAITIRWSGDARAENYILMRARDGINSIGHFEEIYRGNRTVFTDRNVMDDIRYVYRVDIIQNGVVQEGNQTGIGVGNSADPDINEPNNRIEEATALSMFRHATMYYFRFSDNRELSDRDWYKARVKRDGVGYIQLREEGIQGLTTLRMKISEQDEFQAEQNKWHEIRNTGIERDFFIEVTANRSSYVEDGITGGTIRRYTIIYTDNIDDLNNESPPWNDNGNNNGSGGTEPGGSNNPEESIIEEKSEFFVQNTTGWLVFLLNDTIYRNNSYTFWKYLDTTWNPNTGMSMELVKESGHFMGGYGFFFAGGYVAGYGETMLVILIQKDGNYIVGKVINGNFTRITNWNNSIFLRRGYGVRNTVGIEWDSGKQEYIILINGIEERRFVDILAPVCNGNKTGVVAVVTSSEEFPQTPVKINYR